MIGEFLYRQPVEIHFGRGKFDSLPALLAEKGIRRALIVCGSRFAPAAEALAAAGQGVCGVYSHVQADPQLSDVQAAAALARRLEAAAHPLMGNNPVPMDEDALCALFTALQ